MNQTNQNIPTKPGWYWFLGCGEHDNDPRPVRVLYGRDFFDTDAYVSQEQLDTLYAITGECFIHRTRNTDEDVICDQASVTKVTNSDIRWGPKIEEPPETGSWIQKLIPCVEYIDEYQQRIKNLSEAILTIKSKWDWWRDDEYSNCITVVEDALYDAVSLAKGESL